MAITPFHARVSSSASNVQLASARAGRTRLHIHNDSIYALRVCEGASATATDYTMYIPPGGVWEHPGPVYTGVINGIWAGVNGAAQVAEGI